jgi:hypothetical protein
MLRIFEVRTTMPQITQFENSAASWRGLAPWLALWGAVAVIRALSEYAAQWVGTAFVQQAVTWAAAAATLAGLIVWLLRKPASARGASLRPALPLLTALASIVLLDYVHAIDAFFAPMFRALVLSVAFVYAGVSGWRGMLALGLWLLAAAIVLGVWYLGYAPLVLEGLSGLALLAAALLVRKQNGPNGTGG